MSKTGKRMEIEALHRKTERLDNAMKILAITFVLVLIGGLVFISRS